MFFHTVHLRSIDFVTLITGTDTRRGGQRILSLPTRALDLDQFMAPRQALSLVCE